MLNAFGPRFKLKLSYQFLQEGRRVAQEVPDAAGLPDAVPRHHLLLLGHLLQGPPEQEERPAAHDQVSTLSTVKCYFQRGCTRKGCYLEKMFCITLF